MDSPAALFYIRLMRILGIDYGRRRIGVALSDLLGWTAQGLPTIICSERENGLAPLVKIVRQEGVERIIIGQPLDQNGDKGRAAHEVDLFKARLVTALGKNPPPIEFWDERFSSAEAERTLLEGDRSRAKRREALDQVAAVLILQGYLDSHQTRGAEER